MNITMLDGPDAEGVTRGRPKKAKEPTHADRAVENAHDSKVRATADWVDGRIDSKKHGEIHKRADKVISCRGRM
jgi:hypothetical protein